MDINWTINFIYFTNLIDFMDMGVIDVLILHPAWQGEILLALRLNEVQSFLVFFIVILDIIRFNWDIVSFCVHFIVVV